ncbi:MAG: DEAD/DEAH box helicase [Clostridium sp.]
MKDLLDDNIDLTKEVLGEEGIYGAEYSKIEERDYLVSNKLITNSDRGNLLNELKRCLSECDRFYFSVAFINFSGLQLLLDTFKELEERGVKGQIITSTYLNFTEPKALDRIREFNNIDLKIFVADKEKGFHTKAYIFEGGNEYKIIIGSSNITQRALKSNIEWNVRVISKKENSFAKEIIEEYINLWNCTTVVDDEFIERYTEFLETIKKVTDSSAIELSDYALIKPNNMQVRAMKKLHRLRELGEDRSLVVAATGTGKTYMSAFDVMQFNPSRMLFLVHREEILRSAEKTFRKIVKNKNITTGFLTGTSKDLKSKYLFSTIQSMNNNIDRFSPEEFDYIVVDEAHHISSPTYERVLSHFNPKFLLGMTATPERCDGDDIYEVFNGNIALEVRLKEALELELVIPFHYFGITDIDEVDLSDVNLNNIDEIVKRLKVNQRVDFIIDKMNFYGFDGDKRKCIGFCANIDHAMYMTEEFNKKGINSICLTGQNTADEREEGIRRLECDEDNLEVIFTVDIFNEGVDIPSINSVLMLRPTSSPIIFIQQLGRGLRKYKDKSFLTVLDFIGNHQKAFLIAIALNGARFYDKDSLKVAVATEFSNIPGCTNIQMDRIAQERILEQLNSENFNAMKYLKEEYLEFKKMNGGRVPYFLTDYTKYDGAPDPLRFLTKVKTYSEFVIKMENDDVLEDILSNQVFYKILKELTDKLPLKRPYEFSIIKGLLKNQTMSIGDARCEITKYIDEVDEDSIKHSFNYLSGKYYDSSQLKNYVNWIIYNGDEVYIPDEYKSIFWKKEYRKLIDDVLNYGLIRYENNYSSDYYGVPYFKLYSQYQMIDAALLSNYTKIHTSFRGSGLITNDKEYFLFIDLHKEEGIKESINYKDKFINRDLFQWQSPNSTSQNSDRGRNITHNKENGVNLHLFVRKYREIDGVVEPYIYIGKGDTIEYSGEKPITVKLKLHNIMPSGLYTEFIKQV